MRSTCLLWFRLVVAARRVICAVHKRLIYFIVVLSNYAPAHVEIFIWTQTRRNVGATKPGAFAIKTVKISQRAIDVENPSLAVWRILDRRNLIRTQMYIRGHYLRSVPRVKRAALCDPHRGLVKKASRFARTLHAVGKHNRRDPACLRIAGVPHNRAKLVHASYGVGRKVWDQPAFGREDRDFEESPVAEFKGLQTELIGFQRGFGSSPRFLKGKDEPRQCHDRTCSRDPGCRDLVPGNSLLAFSALWFFVAAGLGGRLRRRPDRFVGRSRSGCLARRRNFGAASSRTQKNDGGSDRGQEGEYRDQISRCSRCIHAQRIRNQELASNAI